LLWEAIEEVYGHKIYVNPKNNELIHAPYHMRYLIDNDGDLLMWDAGDLVHYEVAQWYGVRDINGDMHKGKKHESGLAGEVFGDTARLTLIRNFNTTKRRKHGR